MRRRNVICMLCPISMFLYLSTQLDSAHRRTVCSHTLNNESSAGITLTHKCESHARRATQPHITWILRAMTILCLMAMAMALTRPSFRVGCWEGGRGDERSKHHTWYERSYHVVGLHTIHTFNPCADGFCQDYAIVKYFNVHCCCCCCCCCRWLSDIRMLTARTNTKCQRHSLYVRITYVSLE